MQTIFKMGTEFWAAIVGAIVGAGIGAMVSYFLQRQNLNEARAERERASRDIRKGLARSLIHKLMKVHSHAGQLDRHMSKLFARASAKEQRPCQAAQVISPVSQSIYFSTEEMGLLIALKMEDQYNDAAMLDERHNSLFALLADFNELKLRFTELFTPEGMTGEVGHLMLTNEQMKAAMPRMLHIDQNLIALRDEATSLARDSWALVTSVANGFNKTLDLALEIRQQPQDELNT